MPGLLKMLLLGLLAVVLGWLVVVGLILFAGARPQIDDADAILVLGAAQWNGRPSPVFRSRLDRAIELYQRGYAPHLIVTGGVGRGDTLSEAEVGRRYAIANGVPEQVIMMEEGGMTSAQSVGAALSLMNDEGLASALVVSDPFHMLRLEILLRRGGVRALRAPTTGGPIIRNRRLFWRYVMRESVLVPISLVLGPTRY